jgi:hypothetical protein
MPCCGWAKSNQDIFPQHATMVSRIDLSAACSRILRLAIELKYHGLCALPEAEHAAPVRRLNENWPCRRRRPSAGCPEAGTGRSAFHLKLYTAPRSAAVALVRKQSGHVDWLRRLNLPDEGAGEIHQTIVDYCPLAAPAQQALRCTWPEPCPCRRHQAAISGLDRLACSVRAACSTLWALQ